MSKLWKLALLAAALATATPAVIAQKANDKGADKTAAEAPQPPAEEVKKVEALFTAAEIPFTKLKGGSYVAVITVEDESERFVVIPDNLDSDPNRPDYQFIKLCFHLGDLPAGTKLSTALAKQLAEWNDTIAIGKVVVEDGEVWYISTLWLTTTDVNAFGREAALGQMLAKDLRKQVAPYLK